MITVRIATNARAVLCPGDIARGKNKYALFSSRIHVVVVVMAFFEITNVGGGLIRLQEGDCPLAIPRG